MLIHRDRTTHVPRFFPGECTGGVPCHCVSNSYFIRLYDNDSTFLNLAQCDTPGGSSSYSCRQLAYGSNDLYADVYNSGSQVRRYNDADLSELQSYSTTYSLESNVGYAFGTSGNYIGVIQNRNATQDHPTATSLAVVGGAVSWETQMPNGPFGLIDGLGAGVAMTSADEVYVVETVTGAQKLCFYNSSGVLQWSTDFTTGGFHGLRVASDDNCWLAAFNGSVALLYCYDTSGSLVTSFSITGETVTGMSADGNGGIWLTTTANKLRHYDNSGTSLANVSEGSIISTRPLACDQTTDDVITVVDISGERRARNFSSSGSTNWTSPSGTNIWSPSGTIRAMWADGSYVWIGGDRVT